MRFHTHVIPGTQEAEAGAAGIASLSLAIKEIPGQLTTKTKKQKNKTHHHRQQKPFRAESLQRVGLGMGNLTPVFGTIDASLLIARASVGLEGGGGGNAALHSCLLSLPRQLPELLGNRQAHWLRLS